MSQVAERGDLGDSGSWITEGDGFDSIARLQEGFPKQGLGSCRNLLLCNELHQ
jgi:hypothetical protein